MKNQDTKIHFYQENVFWIIFFCVFPLVGFKLLLDHDLVPKLILLAFITLLLVWKSWKNKNKFEYVNRVKILYFTVFVFIIYAAISSISSINSSEGITKWFSLVIPFIFLFALSGSGFINTNNIFKYAPVTVLLLGSVLVYQLINNIIVNDMLEIDNTLHATLSNKNFLSESLILLLPFTLSGWITSERRIKKLNIVASLFILVIVFILQTISAWICVSLLLVVFLPLYNFLFTDKKTIKTKIFSKRTLIWLIAFLLIICLAGMWLHASDAFVPVKSKFISTMRYLQSDFDVLISKDDDSNTNSVFERIFLWRNTLKLGEENIMTGIGLSNWNIMWPKYGVGGASFLSSGVMHYEHPHNEFLLYFSELGLLGLVLFLSMFILVFIHAVHSLKKIKSINTRKIIFLMSAGVFSFMVLSLLGYPFHRPFSSAILMLAIAIILKSGKTIKKSQGNSISYNLILIACFIITISSLRVLGSRFSGEYYMQKAFMEQSKGRFQRMIKEVNRAENNFFKIDLTGTPLDWYRGFAHHYTGSDSALFYFLKADEQNPYHIQIINDIGASLENNGQHEEAVKYLRRALKIIPGFVNAHYNLAISYYNLNKPGEALSEINQAYAVGDTYQKSLEAILILNAELLLDSLKTKESRIRHQLFLNDVAALKAINKISVENNIPFIRLLKDSCLAQY